jgi:hypothetical protein
LLTTFTIECTPLNLFSSFKKLRKAGFGTWDGHIGTEVQKMLSSITSKHLSTISLELAHPDWFLCRDDLESALYQLADRRLANGKSPLVLEILWWRVARHEDDCGTTCPDTIMPRFREKGLIRFMDSNFSKCKRCAGILEEESQASGA